MSTSYYARFNHLVKSKLLASVLNSWNLAWHSKSLTNPHSSEVQDLDLPTNDIDSIYDLQSPVIDNHLSPFRVIVKLTLAYFRRWRTDERIVSKSLLINVKCIFLANTAHIQFDKLRKRQVEVTAPQTSSKVYKREFHHNWHQTEKIISLEDEDEQTSFKTHRPNDISIPHHPRHTRMALTHRSININRGKMECHRNCKESLGNTRDGI